VVSGLQGICSALNVASEISASLGSLPLVGFFVAPRAMNACSQRKRSSAGLVPRERTLCLGRVQTVRFLDLKICFYSSGWNPLIADMRVKADCQKVGVYIDWLFLRPVSVRYSSLNSPEQNIYDTSRFFRTWDLRSDH
jgi:hypothetical protein